MRYKFCFLFLFFFLSITQILKAQEIKLTTAYGYATVETNTSKTNKISKSILLGTEFNIGVNWKLTFGISHNSLLSSSSNNNNSSTFITNHFLIMPISVKKYYMLSKRSSAFFEFGVYPSYNFQNKNESITNGVKTTVRENNLGYSFGGHSNFGFKTTINSIWSFDAGISGQEDFLLSFKDDSKKVKANRVMLAVSFYKKFK